jgi:L-iditol 2-dehydrogenase
MRAATYTQGQGFSVRDVKEPDVGPGEMVLRVHATALCGTDVKIVRNGHWKLHDGQCIVLGHEIAGEIAALGSGVDAFKIGQRVGIAPNAGCGVCRSCVRGESNYCDSFTAFGIDRDGAHAPLVRVPSLFLEQGNVIPLPDSMDDVAAALLEPLSCVVNGVQSVSVGEGDRVVVYGVGPMGLLHVMTCRALGAKTVIAIDPVEARLAQARELGADMGIDPTLGDVASRVKEATGKEGADVVITACPVASVQSEALGLLATHGRLCLFGGLPKGSDPGPMDTNAIHYRHLTITGTTGGSVANYRTAMELVESGRVDPRVVVSDTFKLDQVSVAYEKALNGATGKVVMVV